MKNTLTILTFIVSTLFGSKLQLINASTDLKATVYAGSTNLSKSLNPGSNLIVQSRNQNTEVILQSNSTKFNYSFDVNDSFQSNDVIAVIIGSEKKENQNFHIIQTKMMLDAQSKRNVDLKLLHASTKHSNIDLYVDGSLFVENLSYGNHSQYLQIPSDARLLSVHKHRETEASNIYDMPQDGLGGKAGILIINNDDGQIDMNLTTSTGKAYNLKSSLGPLVERDQIGLDQNDLLVEVRETAQVQIVHNSPSPAVDVYVDGNLAVENFTYRSSTGLVDLPLSTVVGIAPTGGAIIAEFPFTLEQGVDYVVVASGVLNDAETPFTLLASTLDQEAQDNESFALKVLHGVTDAPAVDIYADGNIVIDSLVYSDFTDYLQLPVGDYTIDITAHGAQEAVASFSAPLTGLGGGAGVLYASGFLAGADTDPAFALVLTTPSSYVVELPTTETVLDIDIVHTTLSNDFSILSNYPNPFNPVTSINYNLENNSNVKITVYDLLGNVVNELFQGVQMAGINNVSWNATNNIGESISSGVYIYKIQTETSYKIGRMMYLK